MMRKVASAIGALIMAVCLITATPQARSLGQDRSQSSGPTISTPAYCVTAHTIGKIELIVANDGSFGGGLSVSGSLSDCFTGALVRSCEYPRGSRTSYLFGAAFWVGAIVGRDTLVSLGADGWGSCNEMHPEEAPLGNMIHRSIIDPSKEEFEGAISEQDYIAVYSDTFTSGVAGLCTDPVDGRSHRPLNIEITQRSFAWSYEYAEDFVLFDYSIANIGDERLRQIYMGIYVDADVHGLANQNGYTDDICGFREKAVAAYLPDYCPVDSDLVNIAWIGDNDGDLKQLNFMPVPHVTATRIVRTPSEELNVAFNWWVSNGDAQLDFGPQTRKKFRDLGTGGMGTPEGDRNKYAFMSNGEFDYDQVKITDIGALDTTWLPANPNIGPDIANGFDTRYLLSFGPFDLESGQTLPLSFAYLAGADVHTDPNNGDNLPPAKWETFYQGLNFTGLDTNATWAEWIYDNPGIDSDSDGYAGEMTICNLGGDSAVKCDTTTDTVADTLIIDCFWAYDNADTIWRKGDGIPDFRGASPPPAPTVRVEPSVGEIRVLFNGVRSENSRDAFSREYDFEGYRVYLARDDRRSSYSVLASFDIEDYNKYVWDDNLGNFLLLESPYLLAELKTMYAAGDTTWHPLDHPRARPYFMPGFPDSIFYFQGQDFNRSILANYPDSATTPIRKIYPNAIRPEPPLIPALEPDSVPDSLHSVYLTDDGYFKYYEYEYTIKQLLPTVPYWINVTAFDYGSPSSGLAALETNPTILPALTYPLSSVDEVAAQGQEVFVYPNPYRLDEDYRGRSFEGRGETDRPNDRLREIHFANLPSKCTISIFSLDGDLVRQIDHDMDPNNPESNHDTWNLITRNTQMVVSGLYYWTVEDSEGKTQIGKLAIIM